MEFGTTRLSTTAAFSIGKTSVLFADKDFIRWTTHRQYDVTPDGQRFLCDV